MSTLYRVALAAFAVSLLAGCQAHNGTAGLFADLDASLTDPRSAYGAAGRSGSLLDRSDLALGKRHFRDNNYGLAERHFRRAVESEPGDAEAWVGLAASYDQLNRFELADRAYDQVAALIGNTPELLNNRGYSYLMRGDYSQAERTLHEAKAKAPENPYIRNNLALLESGRTGAS